jgi:phospholipase/carboxylesterase
MDRLDIATQRAVVLDPPGEHTATVIWLHGLGADGHDFEPIVPVLDLPQRYGIRFVFPHALSRPVTINSGFIMPAWYDVRDRDLSKDEDAQGIQDSARIINGFIGAEVNAGVPSTRIVLAGFSQGGAMALYCGLRYPETLAGILALSTYLPLPKQLAQEAHTANRAVPIFMAHGLADTLIPVYQGWQSCMLLKDLGYPVVWHDYTMQHAVCPMEIADIGTWIKARLID